MGERLTVDPQNSNILYFGARSGNGLWKSTDAGVTWTKVSSFTAVGTYVPDPTDTTGYNSDIIGLTWVTFDSTSSLLNGATSRIFVGTADNITASVYVSNDAGATWSPVAGQTVKYFPHKGKLQPTEKALYISYSDGAGPYDGTMGSVCRYDIAAGTWKDITPVNGSNLYFGFGGLGVDMQNPGTIVVASLNSWWPDAQLFRSTDSGTTWSPIWEWASYPTRTLYYDISTAKAPWIGPFIENDGELLGWMIEALEIDPFDSDHWLYGTGLTLFGGHDLTNWDTVHNVTIQVLADGIEEMAVQDLQSAPSGPELLVAVGDDGGFTFKSADVLETSPATYWQKPTYSTSTSVDYAGNKPSNVVRVGNSASASVQQIGVSSDGGATWNIGESSGTMHMRPGTYLLIASIHRLCGSGRRSIWRYCSLQRRCRYSGVVDVQQWCAEVPVPEHVLGCRQPTFRRCHCQRQAQQLLLLRRLRRHVLCFFRHGLDLRRGWRPRLCNCYPRHSGPPCDGRRGLGEHRRRHLQEFRLRQQLRPGRQCAHRHPTDRPRAGVWFDLDSLRLRHRLGGEQALRQL